MSQVSLNKLGGQCVIVGPLLSLVFFLLTPGAILVDRADPSDLEELAGAMTSNAELTHITSLVIALSLVLGLFGLYVVQRSGRDGSSGDAISRLGLFFLAIGMLGWIISQGLNHVVADQESIDAAVTILSAGRGIALMSNLCISFGFLGFALGLANRDGVNKVFALVAAAVSAVAAVCILIGAIPPDHSQLNVMLTIARSIYFIWVAWLIVLGVGLMARHDGTDG